MRFFVPIVFLVVAAYVYWHNANSDGEVLMLAFMGVLFPSMKGSAVAMGQATSALLGGLGLLLLLRAALRPTHSRDEMG